MLNCNDFGPMAVHAGQTLSPMPDFLCRGFFTVYSVFNVTKRRKATSGAGFRQRQCSGGGRDGAVTVRVTAVTVSASWPASLYRAAWR